MCNKEVDKVLDRRRKIFLFYNISYLYDKTHTAIFTPSQSTCASWRFILIQYVFSDSCKKNKLTLLTMQSYYFYYWFVINALSYLRLFWASRLILLCKHFKELNPLFLKSQIWLTIFHVANRAILLLSSSCPLVKINMLTGSGNPTFESYLEGKAL